MSSNYSVILVDGSSYLFRAYHAIQGLRTSDDFPTNAIRGVISMIRAHLRDYPDAKVIVVFDAKGKTFRNDMYAEYKANRPPMEDDLRVQIEPIHQIIEAMGLPLLVVDGVEADDVIGTLAKEATEAGVDTLVSTGDKDMAQLVNQHVTLINTMDKNNPITDPARVEEKYGFGADKIIDYLALMGDSSDNIPGVAGVGQKTAVALLQGIGDLESIYNNLEAVRDLSFRGAKKMPEKLADNKEMAFLSYELATIKTDVELPFSLVDIQHGEPDSKKLAELFKKFEFKTWLHEISSDASEPSETVAENKESSVKRDYETILTKQQLQSWCKKLQQSELFAVDTETTSLNYMVADLVGLSFATEPGVAAYLPLTHDYLDAPEQLDRDWALAQLKPILESAEIKKVGQNLKYDSSVLARYDIALNGIAYDTMLESYIYNSVASRHDMNSLAMNYLGMDTIHFEDIAGKGAKQIMFNQIDIEKAAEYAAEDADITLQLHQKLWPMLEQQEGPKGVFEHIEMPLLSLLSKIERTGVYLDGQLLREKSQTFAARMAELQQKAFELAGEEFNLGSPKQLQRILFEKLELPVIKKTPKKQPSTAEDVLQELALDYPLPHVILEYRGLSKLKSTYTDKLPEMINHQTGRLHTSYHQAVAATGRLSSTDPNLQNIPIKNEAGRSIRQAFIAPKGRKILAADYSQIELRIMAHLSQDEGLLSAFAEGKDIHTATAAEVFSVSAEQVTQEQRRSAKAINFGLIYGMSAFGLAKQIGVGREEAQHYIDTYFARYPGVEAYMEQTKESARENGYVETLYGRRLYLPEINASNGMRRKGAERTAINAPMQGSAADIIKLAMLSVDQWITESRPDCKMVMQVHDELVFEVAEQAVESCSSKIIELMQSATEISVPLLVEAGVGDNWDEAH
ncbi:DNA polymerase I [Pleionea mediterranea]|uniref:DNA polymerase I n=1 Tax=Pleionea mediterranea TaxID=523701 RepID=A0A316FWL3_9GAMM|nr:DNA polymerase I [Pleionea mediterranea]PWK52968.1 DNA polymerase I [Pleionea mediterranea]